MQLEEFGNNLKTLNIPQIDQACHRWITINKTPATISKNHQSKTESSIKTLQQLMSKYKKSKKKKQIAGSIYKLTPYQRTIVPSKLRQIYMLNNSIVTDYNKGIVSFFKTMIIYAHQMIKFLEATINNNIICTVDVTKFQNDVSAEFDKRFENNSDKKLNKKLNQIIAVHYPSKISYILDEQALVKHISSALSVVEKKLEYCPPSNVDQAIGLYLACHDYEPQLEEFSKQLEAGDASAFLSFLTELSRGIPLTSQEEFIVLKCGVIRRTYELQYIRQNGNTVLSIPADNDQFIRKCILISTYSPRTLGISESLFTQKQIDTPMLSLAKLTPAISEISQDLHSLAFYSNPLDMMYVIVNVLLRLDSMARHNAMARKLGQFVKMVENENIKNGVNMMSFDDCFSLFFPILAINPPINALAICTVFETLPDITKSMTMKYSTASFVSAIHHILQFTEQQVEITDEFSNEDLKDPLGILT